jgi:hypothetical protein
MSNLSIKRLQVGNSTAGNNFVIRQPDAADATLRISNGNIGTTTDLVTINSTGNVSIGNTSPSAYNASLTIQRAGQSSLMLWNSGIGSGQLGFTAASSNLKLYNTYTDGLLPNGKGIDVDTVGRVTMPNQPTFWAWNGQGSTTGITSDQLITFSNTDLNIGGNYSTATGRFTAPIAGVYQFNCMGLYRANGGASRVELTFFRNGANVSSRGLAYASPTSAGQHHQAVHIQYIANLAAGDFIQPYGLVASPANFYLIERLSWFSGRLLG